MMVNMTKIVRMITVMMGSVIEDCDHDENDRWLSGKNWKDGHYNNDDDNEDVITDHRSLTNLGSKMPNDDIQAFVLYNPWLVCVFSLHPLLMSTPILVCKVLII